VIFQGAPDGPVDAIIREWSRQCIPYMQNLPPVSSSDRPDPDRENDQTVLTRLLKQASKTDLVCLKLDYGKYCGVPDLKSGKPRAGALVDQWMMNEKMRLPQDRDRNWPPPEETRRQHAGRMRAVPNEGS
jgi:hypothetical protein